MCCLGHPSPCPSQHSQHLEGLETMPLGSTSSRHRKVASRSKDTRAWRYKRALVTKPERLLEMPGEGFLRAQPNTLHLLDARTSVGHGKQ